MKLFLGNLPYDITEVEVTSLCAEFGEVVNTNLIKDAFSGNPKGFAFIEMANRSGGQQAMEALNKKTLRSRNLVCNEAKPNKKKGKGRR